AIAPRLLSATVTVGEATRDAGRRPAGATHELHRGAEAVLRSEADDVEARYRRLEIRRKQRSAIDRSNAGNNVLGEEAQTPYVHLVSSGCDHVVGEVLSPSLRPRQDQPNPVLANVGALDVVRQQGGNPRDESFLHRPSPRRRVRRLDD